MEGMTTLKLVVCAAAIALALLGASHAAHAQSADVAERWVGTWTGKATWKKCTTAGPAKLALDLAAARGVIVLDGDQLMDGLGSIDLVTGLAALSSPRADLSLTVTWTKKGAKLALKTAAGCTAKATLTRVSSGIPACDTALALRTAAGDCSLTDVAGDVAADRGAWKKLKGKAKKAQAAQCAADVETVRTAVTGASCLLGAVGSTGIPGCDQYLTLMDGYLRCDKIPQATRDAARQGMEAMKQGFRDMGNLPDDVKKQTHDACLQAVDALRQGAQAMGCAL